MFTRYLFNLYKQYLDAEGIKCNLFNEKKLSSDFLDWIALNKLLAKEYSNYLSYLGYHDSKTVAEIGKGRYDSIATSNMTVISPYADTLYIAKADLFTIDGIPLALKAGKLIPIQEEILLTHNPYEEMIIQNWSEIHNLGQYDISIGMYGNIYDKNFKRKIESIKEISSKMTDDHRVDYDTDKDKYFCTLNSQRNVKVKTLIR